MTDTNNTDGAALLPVTIPRELFDFLMGVAEIDGTSFGEMNAKLPGRFWWRALLRTAASATQEDAERSGADELRRLLDNVGRFLYGFAQADLDEGAADAVTVGMVYQQQAQTVVLPRIRAALASLSTPAQPVDETERLREVIADPNAVHVNMLRGSIAKPSIAQFIHLYGEDAVRAALHPQEGEVSRG